jgi:hypothetical protein
VAQQANLHAQEQVLMANMEIMKAKSGRATAAGHLKLLIALRKARQVLHVGTIHEIQKRVEALIEEGGGADMVTVDLINRRVNMSAQIEFEGGKAVIKEVSMPLVGQVRECVTEYIPAAATREQLHLQCFVHLSIRCSSPLLTLLFTHTIDPSSSPWH